MSLVHGGAPLPIFSASTYEFLCGKDPTEIKPTITELSQASDKTLLKQVP